MQISRWVLQTCRYQRIEIGAILADDLKLIFSISRQEIVAFLVKSIVLCTDELNHKIALK